MTLRDVADGLIGVLIGALASYLLITRRNKAASAAKRRSDFLAFLYKWFAQMAASPTSPDDPPTHTEDIFQKSLPQFREHIAMTKADFEGNAAFEKVVGECVLTEEDMCQPPAVVRTLLLAKVQAVADFIEDGQK